jgi:tetratricopeptide (TPR) repeat protein
MRRSLSAACLFFILLPAAINAQRDTSRTDYLNAESWFLFEDYAEAEPIYQKLLLGDPGNDQLKYKIGICLLNDPYRKDQSIRYLLEASNNINPDYKENSFKERTAPPDVLYYLGNAYLVNEMLDRAVDAYERFLKILDPEVYDEELVREHISACENARRLRTMPVDIDLYPLGSGINTRYPEINPAVSGDGKRMAFVTKQPFFDEALFVEKVDGEWTLPMSITSMLGFDQDIYPVSLNYDGTEMVLYYDDDLIGNLYISRYKDGFWLPAEKLGENISTKYWESHGCFNKEGDTLYFTSNRKGTFGGLDIYVAQRFPDGSFGIPENLGPTINTRYNEETPFITEDGQTLYFSSYGHYNIGGYDIFYSKRNRDGSWGQPVNLGYPINTTDDDIFFQPVDNGRGAYYSLYSNVGQGRHDIYYMDIYSTDNPRMYMVTGILKTEDRSADLTGVDLVVRDAVTGEAVIEKVPIDETGAFSMKLPQGSYALHFNEEGYQELVKPLQITTHSNKSGIVLTEEIELSLIHKEPKVFVGEESLIQLEDTLYEAIAGKPLNVPLRLEKGAILVTKVYQDSVLVSVDTMEVKRHRTELELIPLPGTSRVELEMTDSEGNIHKNEFTIIAALPEPAVKAVKAEPKETKETAAVGGEVQPGTLTPALLLLPKLQDGSEGTLHETLMQLDPEKEGIRTGQELFDHLYQHAGEDTYSKREVDLLLAGAIAGDDVQLLYQHLLENSEGPLKAYLETLDLEAGGITTPEALIETLEREAATGGFTMDEVRAAMLRALEQPLEVDRVYERILEESDGPIREILEGIDLRRDGIYTVEELITAIYNSLAEHGYNNREIREILSGMFPDHTGFIEGLLRGGRHTGLTLLLGGVITAMFLLLIILWFRRRKKQE